MSDMVRTCLVYKGGLNASNGATRRVRRGYSDEGFGMTRQRTSQCEDGPRTVLAIEDSNFNCKQKSTMTFVYKSETRNLTGPTIHK